MIDGESRLGQTLVRTLEPLLFGELDAVGQVPGRLPLGIVGGRDRVGEGAIGVRTVAPDVDEFAVMVGPTLRRRSESGLAVEVFGQGRDLGRPCLDQGFGL